jgi:hypothetical protein
MPAKYGHHKNGRLVPGDEVHTDPDAAVSVRPASPT